MSKRILEQRYSRRFPLIGFHQLEYLTPSQIMHFPATRRELLDKLQVKLVVLEDRIEVNAVFPVEAISYQKCTSTRETGEGFGLLFAKRFIADEVRLFSINQIPLESPFF